MIFLYLIFRGMASHSPNFFLAVGMRMRQLLKLKLDNVFRIVYIIAIIVVLRLFLAGVL